MNFIKEIFFDDVGDKIHRQFIRFGKGDYKGRFTLNLWKTKKVKVKTSFEFANDLVLLCSEFESKEFRVSGIVLSKKDISDIMSRNNIKGVSEKKRGIFQNNIDLQELNEEQLKELEKESYSTLLDLEGDGFKLKIKKKIPRPGKSEKRIDNKFCQLEADEKYYSKIKEDFFWDMPKAKKINISHEIIINEIIMPEGEKDFAKIREAAKRKGKIIRHAVADDKEILSEKEFVA